MPNVRKERKGKRVIIDNRRFILYKRSSFKYIYTYISLLVLERYSLQWREREAEIQREAVQMGRTSENKKEKILSSFHRLGHPRNRNGTRRTVKHVPFLEIFAFALSFLLFCFLFFSLLFFFLIQQIPEGERKEVFTSNPPRNVTLTMQMKNSPLFTGPRHFLTVPLTSTRRITVRQVTNESCIIFTARSRISRKMSRGHYPRHFFLLFFFSSPSRFFSLQATHAWDFHWF